MQKERSKKHIIEQLKQTAENNNLECLSNEFISYRDVLIIKCKICNNIYNETAEHILENKPCPNCAKLKRYLKKLEDYKQLGKENKLILIYDQKDLDNIFEFIGQTYFNWKCEICSTTFQKRISLVGNDFRGHNCIGCYNIAMQNYAIELAAKKDGYYLSKFTLVNSNDLWQCKKNHTWDTSIAKVEDGHWCPYCAEYKGCIEDMRAIAELRGGNCLSDEYINSSTELLWECFEKHQFWATPYYVKNNGWCKECRDTTVSIGERIVKCNCEQIFNGKFIKIRLDNLRNSRGNKMELDGYCSELMVAFEYNGEQHDNIITKFDMTEESLQQRKDDDKLKAQLCKEIGIKLIVIKEIQCENDYSNLKELIKQECIRLEINIPENYDDIVVNLRDVFKNHKREILEELKNIAKEKGGELLTDIYVNSSTDLYCRCKDGYEFITYATNLKIGCWCPHCSPSRKLTLDEVQEFAQPIGLKCISDIYIGQNELLDFSCDKNSHIFPKSFKQLKRFPYCPICRKEEPKISKYNILIMKAFAIQKNGECLSNIYKDFFEKLTWKCNKHNYVWDATAASVISGGRWCIHCGRERTNEAIAKRSGSLDKVKILAKECNLTCLSNEYTDRKDNMQFQCNKCNDIFFRTYGKLKTINYCSKCKKQEKKNHQ